MNLPRKVVNVDLGVGQFWSREQKLLFRFGSVPELALSKAFLMRMLKHLD